MHNLDEIVKMYFSYVSAQEILKGTIPYNDFPELEFERLSRAYITYYSDTENGNLYEYVARGNRIEGHPYAGLRDRSGLNVFAALEELAEQLLIMEENQILCKYCELLRFRNVTNYIDEDLLVCAFLVARSTRYYEFEQYKNFGWNTVMKHNNAQLRGILQEGISENHFHLYGSAPLFHLTWLDFMNNLTGENQIHSLHEIGNRPRVSRNHYYIGYQEETYERAVLKAAFIRVFLITYLLGEDFLDRHESLFGRKIEAILRNEEPIEDYRSEIQEAIDFLKLYFMAVCGNEAVDYALYIADVNIAVDSYDHACFAGERWLIYQILKKEMDDELEPTFCQWFYAYLVIKHNLRRELVQTNETVGFENFQIYTRRKKLYGNSGRMALMAVRSSFLDANLRALEIRINIKNSASKNAEAVAVYDDLFGLENQNRNIYYVFSFSKKPDAFHDKIRQMYKKTELERQEMAYQVGRQCRHYEFRKKLNKQVNELQKFREYYPKEAGRVLGIDACSQEIGCRPEVFAPAFRFLAEHVICNSPDNEVTQLKITYHVGEDFLDVADGLRAVDEALHFLDLQCGDRIGHGTVLGIDVHKWYRFKRNTIVLSQQDYLDNVVWIYHKLIEFKIIDCEGLQQYLSEQFDIYFSKIYAPQIHDKELLYSIHSYYEAWKLRGDEPELYQKKKFDKYGVYTSRNYLINYHYPQTYDSRYRKEVARMYYMYHYDLHVREEGLKTAEFHIPPIYVEGVCKIQKAMQKYIASCGIGIETNPSSNLLISTIENYDEHPIVKMFNKDLTYNKEMLEECAQINVSINTDDKGVFRTSLENEYALMACALEKVRDKDGKPVYNRQMIFSWLENIRKMGNLQSFYRENKKEDGDDGFNIRESDTV